MGPNGPYPLFIMGEIIVQPIIDKLYHVELGQSGGVHAFSSQMLDAKLKLSIDNKSPMWLAHDNELRSFYISNVDPDSVNHAILEVHPVKILGLISQQDCYLSDLPILLPWERHNHMIGAYINLMHYFYGHSQSLFHESVAYCRVLTSTVELMSSVGVELGGGVI